MENGTQGSMRVTEEENQERRQVKEIEIRLHGVRTTKKLLQEKLDRLNAEADRLETHQRQSRKQQVADTSKLSRVEMLRTEEARRRQEAETLRQQGEAARKQREEQERQRRETTVQAHVQDTNFDDLDAFLADDSEMP